MKHFGSGPTLAEACPSLRDPEQRHRRILNVAERAWIEQFETARARQKGSKKVLDFFTPVTKMVEHCVTKMVEHCAVDRPDRTEMSDEETEGELSEQFQRLILRQPGLAVAGVMFSRISSASGVPFEAHAVKD